MRLLDHIIQCRTPFVVSSEVNGGLTRLSGPMDLAPELLRCPTRYVLSDDLTTLCTELAYSKGTTLFECLDFVRIPAERLWLEWCEAPWRDILRQYRFPVAEEGLRGGRRGVFIHSEPCGLQGSIRSLWSTGDTDHDVYASAMEGFFYLNSAGAASVRQPIGPEALRITDKSAIGASFLSDCFHFQFEESWAAYYDRNLPDPAARRQVRMHALGGIALAIPVVLAFLLLLATRNGLPQRACDLSRVNRTRMRNGREPLQDHIEVRAPLLPDYRAGASPATGAKRHGPRLHHVRGHLVRRGSQLCWRTPHLRGRARLGTVQTRTVTWTFEQSSTQR